MWRADGRKKVLVWPWDQIQVQGVEEEGSLKGSGQVLVLKAWGFTGTVGCLL